MRHELHIVYTPIEDGWFRAQAPELPGAVTQGATMDEARREFGPRKLEGHKEK